MLLHIRRAFLRLIKFALYSHLIGVGGWLQIVGEKEEGGGGVGRAEDDNNNQKT